jgi:ribosomal protein S14
MRSVKKSLLKPFFLLVLFYSFAFSMNSSFIKKKTLSAPHKVFKPVFDHYSRIMPFSSSKLFVKLSRQRNLNSRFEKSISVLKFLLFSPSFSRSRRSFVSFQFDNSLKKFSNTKHLSTTLLNGRCNSSSRDFKLSRISLRKFAAVGLLPGAFKSSW